MQTKASPTPAARVSFDFNLEALRGIAALLVLWGHLVYFKIDPGFVPKDIDVFPAPGHLCVLLFFILSGYVIGLTNPVPITRHTVAKYIKKRIVRLYPIYLLSLLLALVVASQQYSVKTIVSHLLMTQGITSPIIMEINPVWSLNYEILFYALFIPLSAYRVNPLFAALVAFLAGVVAAYLYPAPGTILLAPYLFGFTFWLTGLALATDMRDAPKSYSYGAMLSGLFLFIAVSKLDATTTIFYQLSTVAIGKNLDIPALFNSPFISFRDIGFLPYCLLIISLFIGRKIKCLHIITCCLLALPAITLFYFYKRGIFSDLHVIVPCLLYGLAIGLYLMRERVESAARWLLKHISITGSFSYGVYIIHFPILWVFMHHTGFSGTLFTFWTRAVAFFFVTILLAYFLERIVQPYLKRFFAA